MGRFGSVKPNVQILDEASTWFVELSEGEVNVSAREEFTTWLRKSPEHVRAFLQIAAVWEDAPLLGNRKPLDIDALLTSARFGSNVVPLGPDAAQRRTKRSKHRRDEGLRQPVRRVLAATILAVAVGAGLWVQWHRGVYATGIGETRWVTLADGSTIELNAESRIRVRITEKERSVDLLQGQALFHVTKNAARPFVVHSGAAQITDVGTEFDVHRRQADTVVTVLEGRVAVRTVLAVQDVSSSPLSVGSPKFDMTMPSHLDARALGTVITAGEQVDLRPHAPPRPIHADVAAATAWTRQTLIFNAAPLSEVVAQYNLYHERELVIKDPGLADYHVSGMFSATDGAALVTFLRQQPTITVHETDDEIDISSRER
jgi:transmembrane sensor